MAGNDEDDDADRAAILARRKRWVALALAGVTAATAASCQPCLTPSHDAGPPADSGTDTGDHD